MEVVIALVALNSGLITEKVFVAVVFCGVFSSILIGLVMKISLSRRRSIRPINVIMTGELIFPDILLEKRNRVIEDLATKTAFMKLGANLSSEITNSALKREEEFGMEIAVPHALMRGIKNPVLVVARSIQGIEWNAPDGLPVKYIFFLVTQEGVNYVHVQLLSSIAKIMLKKGNGELLELADGEQGFWEALKTLFSVRMKG